MPSPNFNYKEDQMNQEKDSREIVRQIIKEPTRMLVVGASSHPGGDDSVIRVPDGFHVYSYSDEYSLADLLSIKSRDYSVAVWVKSGLNSLEFVGTVHCNNYDQYADFIINRWPAHAKVA